MYCTKCGKPIPEGMTNCPECAATNKTEGGISDSLNNNYPNYSLDEQKSKMAAGLFGIFLGSFGAHNFYLGYTGKAVAQLLITVLTCGLGAIVTSIWGLIEGIMILSSSVPKDAKGIPLKD